MKKKLKKSLFLNKTTIASLNNEEMNHAYGGDSGGACPPVSLYSRRPRDCGGTWARACDPGSVAVTCGCNTLTDCS